MLLTYIKHQFLSNLSISSIFYILDAYIFVSQFTGSSLLWIRL